MKIKTLIIALIAITLGSCTQVGKAAPTTTAVAFPYQIINHEMPQFQVDFSPFTVVGCDDSDGYENWYRCNEGSLMFSFGCNSIENKPLLGGLTPNYPIAACSYEISEHINVADLPPDGCVYVDGGLMTFCNRYVIYKDAKYQLIKTLEELRAAYAPIDSPEEALSFVLASDDLIVNYGQAKNNDYVYFVEVLEDSYVETITDGYIVHVFDAYSTCESFDTKSVQMKVTHDGYLTELNRTLVYRDPSQTECE
jgi:hypothetical protein